MGRIPTRGGRNLPHPPVEFWRGGEISPTLLSKFEGGEEIPPQGEFPPRVPSWPRKRGDMKCRETPREEEQNKRSKPQPHYSSPSTISSRCWAPARIYFQGNIKLSGKGRRGKVWGRHLQIVALHHTQLSLVVTLPGGENDLLKRRRVELDTYMYHQ